MPLRLFWALFPGQTQSYLPCQLPANLSLGRERFLHGSVRCLLKAPSLIFFSFFYMLNWKCAKCGVIISSTFWWWNESVVPETKMVLEKERLRGLFSVPTTEKVMPASGSRLLLPGGGGVGGGNANSRWTRRRNGRCHLWNKKLNPLCKELVFS